MSDKDAFFAVYGSLVRAGPGLAEDVDWALSRLGPPSNGDICDAGCGPGADIPALLAHVPEGHVTAVEAHVPFVEQVQSSFADDPRVTALVGDMAALPGRYDAIWCAGALYFIGVREGLEAFRPTLNKGGGVAFSQPCWFTDTPSQKAHAFWGGYDGVATRKGLLDTVWAAGFDPIADRPLADAAWEAYYRPMEARIAELRPGAPEALAEVLDSATSEIETWREVRAETGYQLVVAVPR